jgi:hypothetical protein
MSTKYPGFKEVTQEEFYAFMGNRNVHPTPIGTWSNEIGYISEWKTPSDMLMGITYGNGYRTYKLRK